jgi:hypothetical protein
MGSLFLWGAGSLSQYSSRHYNKAGGCSPHNGVCAVQCEAQCLSSILRRSQKSEGQLKLLSW